MDARRLGVPAPERAHLRVSDAPFSPGDDFCNVWHFFDLMPEGPGAWQPKHKYG